MREKRAVLVLLPCIELPGFKKIILESGIMSESLKREAAEQQLLLIIISVMKDNDSHK